MSKNTKDLIIEITKCVVYGGLGIGIGCTLSSELSIGIKLVISISLVVVLVLVSVLIKVFFTKINYSNQLSRTSFSDENSRVSSRFKTDYERSEYSNLSMNRDNSMVSSSQISRNSQVNALDRKPIRAEKKEIYEKNRVPATKLVLLNEEGTSLLSWSLQSKTSLIIGKSTDKEPVDVDLGGSAVATMISKQHAVLNYTDNGWYIDDIDSKNGTRVKKITQNSIMDVKLVGAIEVEPGDIIYIANAMLQIQ